MNILVTGGAGYIGSHTCKMLHQQGHQVFVYDNLSTGWKDFVKWGALIEGDTRDKAGLRKAMRDNAIDGVVHFAAKSTVDEAIRNPGEYYSNNVIGTLSLLEAMRDEGVGYIVVSGTSAVYGEPESFPIKESAPTQPINPYGESKLMMEWMLRAFQAAHGIAWVSLRYFNAAGGDPDGETGERHIPETHLIPRVLMAASGGIGNVSIFGTDYPTPDGTCVRDYIHVNDLASAHSKALKYLADGGESIALNLGSGTGISVKEIVAATENTLGHNIPVTIGPRRAGDPPFLIADASLAFAVLGWKPEHSSAREIIETAWQWMQSDPQKGV